MTGKQVALTLGLTLLIYGAFFALAFAFTPTDSLAQRLVIGPGHAFGSFFVLVFLFSAFLVDWIMKGRASKD